MPFMVRNLLADWNSLLAGNVMSIDHTYAFKKGMGIGGVLVSAANDYAISKGLKVMPVCSFGFRVVSEKSTV